MRSRIRILDPHHSERSILDPYQNENEDSDPYQCDADPLDTAEHQRREHKLNMEQDLQSLFGLHVYSCTHWPRPRDSTLSPRIWAHIRGRYWSGSIEYPKKRVKDKEQTGLQRGE